MSILSKEKKGFGAFLGVFLPGILTMFGVIIFLRMGWIVGVAGLPLTLLIITFGALITFLTALSIASTATNMEVKSGGTYYMISRFLGIEMGSAVGVPLFISQILSVPLCILGFAVSLSALIPAFNPMTISLVTLGILTALSFTSLNLAMRTQLVIFIILICSFISLFMGGKLPVDYVASTAPIAKPGFWTIFAIFFPAATGIEAGVALSGSLKNPRKSLPIGTISIIGVAWLVYCSIAIFLWWKVPAHILASDTMITQKVAKFGFLIYAGIWSATLSSALGCLLSSARTLQALASDGVFPAILARNSGKTSEPRIATAICALISLLILFTGGIDQILPVLAMFLLIAYSILNLGTAAEDFMAQPSWRPTFRIPWYVSLLGFFLSLIAMLMINAGWTLIAASFSAGIYLIMKRRDLSASWEDLRQSFYLFFSRFAIYRLSHTGPSARSWRPNFLVFSENPSQLSNLIDVTSSITRNKGFLTLASIFNKEHTDMDQARRWQGMVQDYLHKSDIPALVEFNISKDFIEGMKKFIHSYGIGPISPNTVVLAEAGTESDIFKHSKMIALCQSQKKNVMVIREGKSRSIFEEKGRGQKMRLKNVDIWWEETSKDTSHLMLLLAHLMQRNPRWKKTNIHLKSLVQSNNAREHREEYFRKFFSKKRFDMTPQVYVAEGGKFEMIQKFSDKSDFIIIGMRAPKEDETHEAYAKYYQSLIEATENLPAVAFVLSAQEVNFEEVLS